MRPGVDVRPLAVAAAAVTVLAAAGIAPTWAGVPHHVALPPLDLFADVRVLLAEARSYPSFVASLAAIVGLRSVVLAAMLRSLDRDGLVGAARFYGIAVPFALVAGGLAFTGVAALYSLFLWVGVAVTLLVTLSLAPRPWRPAARPWRRLGGVVVYLVALLALSLPSALGGTAIQLVLVWVSSALTAVTVRWLGRQPERGRTRPLARVAPVLAVAGLVAVSVVAAQPPSSAKAPSMAGTLFVVPGIGASSGTSSMFHLDPAALGFDCDRTVYFSYAGPGDGAPQREARCPIRQGAPYRAADTGRPLDELVGSFRAQYADLDPPVVVIAHSQGAWVTTAAIGRHTGVAPPAAVVLLGAFPGHAGGYRLDGTGAGVVGTDMLELVTGVLRGVGSTTFDPRAPLSRQLLGTGGAVDDLMRRGFAPSVRVLTVTSAFDLPIMGGDRQQHGVVDLCPVYVHHGDLPRSPQVHAQVRRNLQQPDGSACGWWRRWPTQAFSAFAVPTP